MHRLNRAEYGNAIRDLFALDVDVTALLPPDEEAFGFDNNANVLNVSTVADGPLPVGGLEDLGAGRGQPGDHARRSRRSACAAICRSTITCPGCRSARAAAS